MEIILKGTKVSKWINAEFTSDYSKYALWIYSEFDAQNLKIKFKKLILSDLTYDEIVNRIVNYFTSYNLPFGFVLKSNNKVIAITDHISSIPLYVINSKNHKLVISDSSELMYQGAKCIDIEECKLKELLLTGYVTGNSTLSPRIVQIPAGSMIQGTTNSFTIQSYYDFWHVEKRQSIPELEEEFKSLLIEIMSEYLSIFGERDFILFMSGGFDSRLILWLVDYMQLENVDIYSYGRPLQRDVKWAKEFAEGVGINWNCIPIGYHTAQKVYQSSSRKKYFIANHHYKQLPFYQDFPALTYLKKRGRLKKNPIFMTGNSGDYVSGAHIPYFKHDEMRLDEVVSNIIKKHYNLWDFSSLRKSLKEQISKNILAELSKSPQHSINSANLFEWWEWRERQSKFVVSSLRQFNWFEQQLFLPLWDKRILEFFKKIPVDLRKEQKFYRDFCNKLKFSNGSQFNSIQTTSIGKVSLLRKFRRGTEYFLNHKWGRYTPQDMHNVVKVLREVLDINPKFKRIEFNGLSCARMVYDLINSI